LIYLDTHVVIWMYQEDLVFSPMVELEIEYLFEIKKITERSLVIIDYMKKHIGLNISDTLFPKL